MVLHHIKSNRISTGKFAVTELFKQPDFVDFGHPKIGITASGLLQFPVHLWNPRRNYCFLQNIIHVIVSVYLLPQVKQRIPLGQAFHICIDHKCEQTRLTFEIFLLVEYQSRKEPQLNCVASVDKPLILDGKSTCKANWF